MYHISPRRHCKKLLTLPKLPEASLKLMGSCYSFLCCTELWMNDSPLLTARG